jgi:glycosyltransferase involved in cell wall biosynthesis
MNILYYDRFSPESMSSIHVYEVLGNLSRLGHNVIFFNANSPMLRTATEEKHGLSKIQRLKAFLKSLPIYGLLKGEILVCFLLFREIFIFLSALIIVVRLRRSIDVIYRRHNLINSEYILSGLFGIPTVKEVNGIIADESRTAGRGDRLSLWLIDRIERASMPRADKIIVVTSKLKDVLRDDYNVPEDRIIVIWNGANTDLFKPMDSRDARRELGLSQDSNYVLYVGSLSLWQGVEYLIKSAPLVLTDCPDTRFLVVGDGAMKEQLIALTKQLGVNDKFDFAGFVYYERVPLYVNASNVCVAPFTASFRNKRTGLSPLKLCEYLACERPVVASSISGLEFVESYEAGILVPPESAEKLSDAIVMLLRSPELREKMGRNGRKFVVENRSWESASKKVAEVCQQAVEARGSRPREMIL